MTVPETLDPVDTGLLAGEDSAGHLRQVGLLDGALDPDIGRWVAALRGRTGSPLAGLRLLGERGLELRALDRVGPRGVPWPDEADLLGVPPSRTSARDSVLEAPIRVEGALLGVLAVVDHGRREWAGEDVQAIDDAASAVSTEIALRLARHAAERAQQLVVSHARVHDLIARAAPLPEVLAAVVDSVERHDPSVLAAVVLLDPESSTLHPGAGRSLPASYLAAIDGVVIGPNVGTCGTAAWSGELVISEDLSTDPKWEPVREIPLAAGLLSCWSMPIKAPGGEVLGTLAFYGQVRRRPTSEQLALLRDWARVAGIAIERNRALERLVHDARHDSLTGLANRMATMEALEEATRRAGPDHPVAVLFVDLDGLKRLNDTLGHDRADEMLREVGARLSATVPEGCVVGRFGGDEFVVVAEGLPDRSAVGALAVRLLEVIAAPLPGRDNLGVTASIGIALGSDAALDARELLREADTAMYSAKRSGRDRCAFYEGGQRVRSGRRVILQRALRGALVRGELHLAYEPVVLLTTGAMVAVEAVPSWESPAHGRVEAEELLAIAGDVGAVVPIGAWVLRESCETVAAASLQAGHPLHLGVDVSLRQLEQPGFAHAVHQILVHSRLHASQLWLEVDEAELARPGTLAQRTLEEIAALGVRMVLDHAGGTLCSPAGLKSLPVHAMKLDRSLIAAVPGEAKEEALAAALVTIAAAFGYSVGGQGIEREEQRRLLEHLGFEIGQGRLFGGPLTPSALADRWSAVQLADQASR